MNAVAQTFTIAFGAVAAAAVIGIGLADHTAEAAMPTPPSARWAAAPPAPVQTIEKLPRVVVEHRRSAAPVVMAQAQPQASGQPKL